MRAVVQRVLSASVAVDGQEVSRIGRGLLVLIGLREGDTEADAEYIARKVLNARLFANAETGRAWDRSVVDEGGDVLCVSQFTLYCRLKGNKPDFSQAMPPQAAREAYGALLARLRAAYREDGVRDGVFGALMRVELVNDGPVTLQLDSQAKE